MKRILFILCVFFALTIMNNAVAFDNCVDSEGNPIITDNPPPGARCESPDADKNDAVNEIKDADCSRIIKQLKIMENKSTLTNSQRIQQTGLLEELGSCDTRENVLMRVNKILNVLESKSALTSAEKEQKTKLFKLRSQLSASDATTGSEQTEADTQVNTPQGDIESDQANRNADLSGKKAETKRLLSIPRPGY